MKNSTKIFAYYLPQYHPIAENDLWWGKGFTEWVTVAQARPMFKGHYQPKIPGELGFYDLRLSETREKQAQLAKDHGISAFCYWHYWLGNGRQLLERPFNEVLELGKPDFPFFLGWANHSWKGVFFGSNKNLIKQKYGGKEDFELHFQYLLKAFKDRRYVKFDNKPLLHIFDPKSIPECKKNLDFWRQLAVKNGFNGLHIIGENTKLEYKDKFGLDAVTTSYHREIENGNFKNKFMRRLYNLLNKRPRKAKIFEYRDALNFFVNKNPMPVSEYPCIVPNWDTTARLGNKAVILKGSTPKLFKKHLFEVFNSIKNKPTADKVIYLKSWNEWAEGNYIEPDRKFGRKYLEVLKEVVDKFN